MWAEKGGQESVGRCVIRNTRREVWAEKYGQGSVGRGVRAGECGQGSVGRGVWAWECGQGSEGRVYTVLLKGGQLGKLDPLTLWPVTVWVH